jgi:hypothetical protein
MTGGEDHFESFTHPSARLLTIPSCPTLIPMKHILFLLLTSAALLIVGCNKQKQAIDAQNDAAKTVIDHQKEAVDAAAKDAKAKAEMDAKIEKANIEAKQASDQAQLDADKKKADAEAAAAKAKVDAVQK